MSGQWNRGSSGRSPVAAEKRGLSPVARGVIAGAVVVIGAAVAAWLLWPAGERGEDAASAKKGLIREVTPAKPKVSAAEQEKLDHPGMVKVRGKWYPEYNSKGGRIWITHDKVRYHTPQIHTNRPNESALSRLVNHFDTPPDREIAAMIGAPLGTMRIGPARPFGKEFEQQFLESLKVPIIVGHDDDENVKALKRAVIETKADLKARYDKGEDIVKIMNDTAKEMHELALYKNELMHLVGQQSSQAATSEEKAELYEAANRMLAERGVEPLRMPATLRRKLELQKSMKNGSTKE